MYPACHGLLGSVTDVRLSNVICYTVQHTSYSSSSACIRIDPKVIHLASAVFLLLFSSLPLPLICASGKEMGEAVVEKDKRSQRSFTKRAETAHTHTCCIRVRYLSALCISALVKGTTWIGRSYGLNIHIQLGYLNGKLVDG